MKTRILKLVDGSWNRRCFCLLTSIFYLLSPFAAQAIYLQPFWYYGVDQFGNPLTNQITIDSWPATNNIVGVGTNVVINVPHIFLPNSSGFVSNNLAPGNYRLKILGQPLGITFGLVSNAAPVNLSQVAGFPVVTFLNFTLAQFSDAGTIASRSSNDFVVATSAGVAAAIGYQPATNSSAGILTPLGFQPATNTAVGILTPLGFQPATNTATGILTPLNFQPATNTATGILTPLNFQPATNTATGILTPLNFQPATNSFTGVVTPLGYTPHTNDGYIGWTNLPVANIATNGFISWVAYKTNGAPGPAFTNLPQGSLLSTTNGQFYVLSNLVWTLK